MELGADDYLVKPFSMRELILRIQALLRRSRSAHTRKFWKWVLFGVDKSKFETSAAQTS